MTHRTTPSTPAGRDPYHHGAGPASALYDDAQEHDRAGRVGEALTAYEAAIAAAEAEGAHAVLVDALRRAGVVRHRRQEWAESRSLCMRSHDVALERGDASRAAEALNALAGFELEHGAPDVARELLGRALAVGSATPAVRGRIEQNLGIIANIRGELDAAHAHYMRALDAYEQAGDERSLTGMYVNLGMISADRERWGDADHYYRRYLASPGAAEDVRVRALVLMNQTEVFLARRQYERARENAEAALAIFDRLGEKRHKSETYKIIGVVYRETGRPVLAETRLRAAVTLAAEAEAVLEQAEASRELALLYQQLNRNQDALHLLHAAHGLFLRLDARRDLVDVDRKMGDLEGTYLRVVREWGESIESADSYTHGHCERVADYAVAVARVVGIDEDELTTIRLGAYLHDVGKVRTPHEILNKPGKLTDAEFAIMQQHPVDGVALLEGVEFPWDITPIIRSHHERYDGSGYPDGLAGESIPLGAQIIGVADVWDALTTTRSYRAALPHDRAVSIMREARHHWNPAVWAAFESALQPGTGRAD